MSGIDNAKQGMGWVSANARACCRNCEHVVVEGGLHFSKPDLRCTKGGFYTQAYAICDQYSPMMLAGSVPK